MILLQTNSELSRYLLGSGALTVILITLIQGGLKLYENRTTLKNTTLSNAAREEHDDAIWNAAYRAAVERHLPWDMMIRQDVVQLRNEVNELRRGMKWEPRNFDPIPPPPALFPRHNETKDVP